MVPPIAKDLLGYVILSSRAYLSLARGDSSAALQQFLALPDTACFTFCALDELQRVQLLEARGRTSEALAWLDRHGDGTFLPALPSNVLRMLARGRLSEKLGRRAEAVAAYAYVAAAWAQADPVLKPYVDEARAGLSRLNAERRS